AGAIGPVPVGEDVCHRQFGSPVGLVEVVAVFGEAGEVDDAKVAGAGVEGGGFADVVPTGPDEFAGTGGTVVLAEELMVGGTGPGGIVQVIGTHLPGGVVAAVEVDAVGGAAT